LQLILIKVPREMKFKSSLDGDHYQITIEKEIRKEEIHRDVVKETLTSDSAKTVMRNKRVAPYWALLLGKVLGTVSCL